MDARGHSRSHCPTSTVDDAPAREDLLGSHEPIAVALHELITSEPGGRTIGLEGGWGSGKSTVVRLLDERMSGPDTHVVVFDAWAHEGDPLRRSFLEELIESLAAKEWIKRGAWHERREKLAKRLRVERTRPVPQIATRGVVAGAVVAIAAMLAPLGAALLNAGLTTDMRLAWMAGAAVSASPIVLVLGALGWLLLRRRPGAVGTPWLSLFAVQYVTESDRETIETPDPTSIEFEATFKDLMCDALGSCPTRRLVLVVDNLDRVAAEDARSVWATLQTFLHHPQDRHEAWLASIWVMLPYDRAGIERLWDGSTAAAESFIEKSIQVQFEVPLPLLTDWREYLESIVRSALPEHDADCYAVYRLYQYRLAREGRAPSPRELKRYVNRIGTLHRRWQDDLPFASLAYYASLGRSGGVVAAELRDDQLPEAGVVPLLGEDVGRHLAAIAFHTDPERALQLLLGPQIERALTQQEDDGLGVLVDRPGFWEALLQSSFVQAPPWVPPSLLLAATRLQQIPEKQRPDAEWREVSSLLASHGRSADPWPALTPESAGDLSDLLSLVDRSAAGEIAVRATAAPIEGARAAEWAGGAHVLLHRFEWLTVRGSGDPAVICDALAAFTEIADWRECADRLEIAPGDRAALEAAITTRVEEAPSEAARVLAALRRMDPDVEWEPFVATAAGRLRERAPSQQRGPQPSASEAQSLLGILRAAADGSREERTALVHDGLALEYLQLASEEGDEAASGDWLYEELRWSSHEERNTRGYGMYARQGRAVLDRLLANPSGNGVGPLSWAVERLRDFDIISRIGEETGGAPLAAALVSELHASGRFRAALSGTRLTALWPHIERASAPGAPEMDELVQAVCARLTLVPELVSEPFAADRMDMYAAMLAAHPDHEQSRRLADWAVTSLAKLTLEQWIESMAGSDNWVTLLRAIRDTDREARIGGAFAQALAGFLERVAEAGEVSPYVAERWENTVQALLAPAVQGAYAHGAAAVAVSVGSQLPAAFFELAGETLASPDVISRRDILNGLMPALIPERNVAGLRWLIAVLTDKEARTAVPEGGFGALTEVVRTSVSEDSDPGDPLLEIARLMSIDLTGSTEDGGKR